ncbi:hypothetical protein [Tindallia californiensis]|uniref:ABC-2 type transport system permease protein n=1 Tax=Tindallia californiensis TaxID=159292 RepID=A0A1H3M7G1_9FIRM|nr:hypothetical protein [Tindallia californiensis]SDY72650.1 hypothetical protein SAMN05192546_10427 [Tindallia californiensis]
MTSMTHNYGLVSMIYLHLKDKLYHYANAFAHLMTLQLLGYFFSMNSKTSGSMGMGSSVSFYVGHITLAPIYIFTMIWLVMQGLKLAEEKNHEYYMVSTNKVAFCSDILLMGIYGVVGSVTLFFSGFLIQAFAMLYYEHVYLHESFQQVGAFQYIGYIISTILYLNIAGAIAYLLGSLKSRFKGLFYLGIIVSMLLLFGVGWMLTLYRGTGYVINLQEIVRFYTQEYRVMVWLMKSVVTLGIVYGTTYLTLRNREVS